MERKVSKYNTLFISLLLITISFLAGCNGSLNFKKTNRQILQEDTCKYINDRIKDSNYVRKLKPSEVDIDRSFVFTNGAFIYNIFAGFKYGSYFGVDCNLKYENEDEESNIFFGGPENEPFVWFNHDIYFLSDFINRYNGRNYISRDDWMTVKNMQENDLNDFSLLEETFLCEY